MQSHSVRRTSVAAFSRTTRRILEFLVCGLTFLNILAAQSFPAGQPYKFVIPVSIDPNGTIVVNGITYSPPNGLTSGVNVVTFNRQSLAIVNDAFPTTSAGFNQYIDAILSGSGGQPTDLLVLIASINNNSGFALGEVASHLEKLGATNEFRNFNVNAPLAFIGHGGLSMNQAYQSATGPISGNFAQDVHSNYAFIPLDYIAYTLDPLGRTVSVGSQTWNDAQTCGNGGFFLVEFDRTNPQSSKLHKCYYTELGDTAQLSALRDDLSQFSGVYRA
ncbi:MAG: hypothetical protein JOY85_07990 [Acidobacteriaceae bacterium]|nr:hypothetical protein [Acidobacteriaceae bacterium]